MDATNFPILLAERQIPLPMTSRVMDYDPVEKKLVGLGVTIRNINIYSYISDQSNS